MTDSRNTGARAATSGAEEPVDSAYRDRRADVSIGGQREDVVRWSSIWAGVLVALATFILLELLFFAFGWLSLEQGTSETTVGLVTAIIGLVAFFAGGMIAGGTSIWTGAREGIVHGVLVWAVALVAILFFTLFGGGALFGSASNIFVQMVNLQQLDVSGGEVQQAVDTARSVAGWAVLGLAVYLAATIIGGLVGAKMGSGKSVEDRPTEVRTG